MRVSRADTRSAPTSMHQEQVLSINRVRIWCSVQGSGLPAVLCHGGPGGYDYLRSVADMIDDLCQIVRYDQRGSGRSEAVGPYDVSTFVDDLDGLRRHYNFGQWIVGGHSWGANLALAYAVRFASYTKAIIYLSGTGIDPRWHDEYRANRLAALSDEERAEFLRLRERRDHALGYEWKQIERRIRELSRKTDAYDPGKVEDIPDFQDYPTNSEVNRAVGADWNAYMYDDKFRQSIYGLDMPALFIHGEGDPRPTKFIKQLADRLVCSEFHLIAKAGHYPWVERPEQVRGLIRAFIKSKCC